MGSGYSATDILGLRDRFNAVIVCCLLIGFNHSNEDIDYHLPHPQSRVCFFFDSCYLCDVM